jgi:hypothetical protein
MIQWQQQKLRFCHFFSVPSSEMEENPLKLWSLQQLNKPEVEK